MATAEPADQLRLLVVQDLDTKLGQARHRLTNLPEHEQLRVATAVQRSSADTVVAARMTASDIERDLAKAEAEVAQVRDRAARDQARLDSGLGSVKDLQALEHEVSSLAARQQVLEEVELEVMERLETAQSAEAAARKHNQQHTEAVAAAESARDAAVANLERQIADLTAEREQAAAIIPTQLLALYETLRVKHAGVGAARLFRGRCEGCRLELGAADLQQLRDAAPDAVVTCDECDRILVRTEESGL